MKVVLLHIILQAEEPLSFLTIHISAKIITFFAFSLAHLSYSVSFSYSLSFEPADTPVSNCVIPKNAIIMMSIYNLHHVSFFLIYLFFKYNQLKRPLI